MQAQEVTPMVDQNADPFLKKWNWGAFLLSWIWSFGHGLTMWGILALAAAFVPIVGGLVSFGIAIYLGLKGNELAWQTGRFASLDAMKQTEQKWTKWAIILFVAVMVLVVLGVVAALVLGGLSATSSSSVQYFMFL